MWQAWCNLTSTFVSRGRRGTYGTAWRAWSPLVAGDAAALCVAGVTLGDIHLRFALQASHKETSTFVLRGRRGTYGTAWRAWSPLVAGDAAAPHCHPPSLSHHLSHTALSLTIFHTRLCHTPSLTHPLSHTIFVTHTHHLSHHLSHTIFHTTLSHTIFHTPLLSHTTLSHTILHTPLCHTPSFTTPSFTHNFVAHHFSPHHLSPYFAAHHCPPHHLSHTTLPRTIFHTQLCHPPSLIHHLSHTQLCHTHLCHTRHLSLSHTIFHIQLCHTQLCFTSRSSTTSFLFPYWQKLSCGVIRSFNLFVFHPCCIVAGQPSGAAPLRKQGPTCGPFAQNTAMWVLLSMTGMQKESFQ